MARIRSIKPEIWLSPQVMNLSPLARLLFVGLITQADDEGRGLADPRRFKAQIFPGDDEATPERIAAWLAECVAQGLVITYDGGPKLGPLYEIPTWNAHQKIDRRVSSRFPKPNGAGPKSSPAPVEIIKPTADSSRTRRGFGDNSSPDRIRIRIRIGIGSICKFCCNCRACARKRTGPF